MELTHFVMWSIWKSVCATFSGMIGVAMMNSSATPTFNSVHSSMKATPVIISATPLLVTASHRALAHPAGVSSRLFYGNHSSPLFREFHACLKLISIDVNQLLKFIN